jgi:hypothetical protein
VVLGSVLAVLAAAALLTMALPFQTIMLEISARTRPTTLDLAIAMFSGLVAAVVVVARGNRISAAIPGVAISVALIPPLAVAGFGIGAGISRNLVFGSLLLFGANLAGIVLSGVAVFLLVALHRQTVIDAARAWHGEGHPTGLAGWLDRFAWVRKIAVFSSPRARVGLVLVFVVALAVPLTVSLREIARETRVESAISLAADSLFDVRDRASIINRQVVYGSDRTQVYLRVATTAWFGQADRAEFERRASALAGEPVRLSLEQLPARGEDIEQLAALIPGATGRPVRPPPRGIGELLVSARLRLQQAMDALALPRGMTVGGMELGTSDAGDARLRVFYASPDSLSSQAREMLELQITRALDVPEMEMVLDHLSTRPHPLDGDAGDEEVLDDIAGLVAGHERLRVELLAPESMRSAAVTAAQRLVEREVPGDRMRIVVTPGGGLRVRIAVAAPPRP